MIRQPRPSGVAIRPDGSFYTVDQAGNPVPDDQRITLTASQLAQLVGGHVAGEREAGSKSTAALVQSTAAAVAKAYAQAGVKAGVEHAFRNSRVRRKVVRDAHDRIAEIVDVREPLPSTAPPAEKPAKKPMGFHPR